MDEIKAFLRPLLYRAWRWTWAADDPVYHDDDCHETPCNDPSCPGWG